MTPRPQILDRLSVLADATRTRILLVLAKQELTVSELCDVLRLPQSTVSRHLKILADGDWIHSRPEGTRRLYRLETDALETSAAALWRLASEEVASTAAAQEDARRLEAVLAQRRQRSREFFDTAADRWDHVRDELFGSRAHALALLGLLDEQWSIADLGCGTGPVAEALAPFVRRVVAVDDSQAMLAGARERLAAFDNIELRHGQLESLPIPDRQLDAATLVLVLHHLPDPSRVLEEVVRVLRPGGRLLLVDLLPHERQEYASEMGHVWMGFSEEKTRRLLAEAGLHTSGFRPLPPDGTERGPGLFAASATTGGGPAKRRRPATEC